MKKQLYMLCCAQVVEDEPLEAVLPDKLPTVRRPSPQAIQIIEKYLQDNKLRLIDLFASFDKNKAWSITRAQFRTAIQNVGFGRRYNTQL